MKPKTKVLKKGDEIINIKTGDVTLLFRPLDKDWKKIRIVTPNAYKHAKERMAVLKKNNALGELTVIDLLKNATDFISVNSDEYMSLVDYEKAKTSNAGLFTKLAKLEKEIDELKSKIITLQEEKLKIGEEIFDTLNRIEEDDEDLNKPLDQLKK